MEEAIVTITFPLGRLPVKGFRCPRCHEEVVPAHHAEEAQRTARDLGLYGPLQTRVRNALKIGSSIGLTLDPEQAKALGIEPGVGLEVGLQGDHLTVRPVRGRRPTSSRSRGAKGAGPGRSSGRRRAPSSE